MLTIINTQGKRKVEGKEVTFPRQKIVTGFVQLKDGETVAQGPKPNEKGELQAGYPTFAELAAFYKGQVEYPTNPQGGILDTDCVTKHAIAGWNQTESNSAFGRSPAASMTANTNAIEKLAKNLGLSVQDVMARFPELAA